MSGSFDIEEDRKKLPDTGRSARKNQLDDAGVRWRELTSKRVKGRVLVNEVRPGFFASGFDLEYISDTKLEVREEPSLFCGVMTSGQPSKVTISSVGEVVIKPYCPILVSFTDPCSCIGEHRAGAKGVGAGCRITPNCLEAFMEDYEDAAFGSLMRALQSGTAVRHLPQSSRLVGLVGRMLQNPYNGALSKLYLEGCMLAFVAEIGSVLKAEQERFSNPGLTQREYDRANTIRQILEENIVETPSLTELSRRIGVNSTTMSNHFRSVFGVTIFKYVRDRRLDLAKAMLRTEDIPVSQIGYRVGFSNPGAFATAYRRRFGNSPSDDARQR